jgi:nucleoside-diphosphate-sugar epimerase
MHSTTDNAGFLPLLIARAREKGVVGYPGEGVNQWPAVHARDLAALFRLALEKSPAGKNWHAVGDKGIPFRELAEAIGDRLKLPVVPIPADVLMLPGYSGSSRIWSRWTSRHPISSPARPSAGSRLSRA